MNSEQERNYNKLMLEYQAQINRDCHNCNNLDGSPAACKLSTKDTQTCKEHPSRPFWKHKEQLTKDDWVERFNLGLSKDNTHNNGGSTDYYKFQPGWTDCQDIIESRSMNFSQGNIFKVAFCFNVGRHSAVTYERELNKIIWFAQRELERIKQDDNKKD